MYLILLLALFGVLGYLLARSRAGKTIDETAAKVAGQARDLGEKSGAWVGEKIGSGKPAANLQEWAASAENVPPDFKNWMAGLTPDEAAAFSKALNNHARSLGLDINLLLSGKLDDKPEQRQVTIDAVAAYSQAYQKAQEVARQEAAAPAEEVLEGEVVSGKSVAEKTSSRRKQDTAAESSEESAAAA